MRYLIRNIDAAIANSTEIYFSRDGFKLGAPLVAAKDAIKFKTKSAADTYLADMKSAGFTGFRVETQ